MARIGLHGLSKNFGGHAALKGVDLMIEDGEFFVLLGPTGAGKTTILRLIAGLETPSAGHVSIDGTDVAAWSAAQRDVALVLQQYSLYPRYTVRQNLEFPLRSPIRNHSQADIDERIERASKALRIGHLMDRKTDRLSGGEMQRVSIGRAIVREPRVFLMDEPLSNLDAKLRESLRLELKDLQMKLGTTFIFVTHDQVEAMSMADRVGVLHKGRIVQIGTPQEVYGSPANTFVAGFVGSPAINLLPAEIADGTARIGTGLVLPFAGPAGAAVGKGPITLGVRPEDLRIGETAGPGAARARVAEIENFGVEQILTLDAAGTRIRAAISSRLPIRRGEEVDFGWDPARIMAFDPATGRNLASAG